jgi:DNA-binding transcriptional ArsR family regulator
VLLEDDPASLSTVQWAKPAHSRNTFLAGSSRLEDELLRLHQNIKQRSLFPEAPVPPVRLLNEPLKLHREVKPSLSPQAVKRLSGPLKPHPGVLPQPIERLSVTELSAQLCAQLESELHPTALRVFKALHWVALTVGCKRGYAAAVTQVTFHLPTELVAAALGMSRTTLWHHLKALKTLGLVDQRGHTTTHDGRHLKDGSLWSIRLHPTRGKAARLKHEDLKHDWRDLTADIERGRTAYSYLTEQSKQGKKDEVDREVLVMWALTPGQIHPPLNMTVQNTPVQGPEVLLDVPFAGRQERERNQMVDLAARSVAHYLGDDSLNFYRYLVWQLLRLRDQGQDHFQVVYSMVRRAGVDKQEGFARCAGALFLSRLKACGLWDALRAAPVCRVGEVPARM